MASPGINKVLQVQNMTDCPICCETFNKSTNAPVTCEYADCGYVACKSCVRTYLTTTNADPCCMKCNKTFSMTFMNDNLNRSFVSKDYRNHRSQLLLERAISQLPEAMGEVERRVQVEEKKKDVHELQAQMRELQARLRIQQNELWQMENKKTEVVKRKFVMGCPREDCRGFLSSQYKCGLCNYHTCPNCLCVKGPHADSEHTCNPDDVASAELIKSQTKPCPACGERISKIEGCDQMWCTSCHTAFSWRTGAIDNGVVHNPHFFQFQRQNANGQADGQPGRGMGQCNANNMPGYYLMRRVDEQLRRSTTSVTLSRSLGRQVMDIYRMLTHIRAHEVRRYQNKVREEADTMGIRVDYLLKKVTKEEMQRKLYTTDRSRRRNALILNLFEVIGDVGLEWVWGLCNATATGEAFVQLIQNEVKKIDELFEYCNREWAKISYDHRITVPVIQYINGLEIRKYNLYKSGKQEGINDYESPEFLTWANSLLTPAV